MHKSPEAGPIDMMGDREVEWSWIASQIPVGPGEALDFGPGGSYLGLIAAQGGFNVTALDLEPSKQYYLHPHINFIQGDISNVSLPEDYFDLVINCSTVEHVGLAGRYKVKVSRCDGDLEAMSRLKKLMKPNSVMLLTVPVGQDAVFAPFHRVYGIYRLPRLLEGYIIEKEIYWLKNAQNKWVLCPKENALNFKARLYSTDLLQDVYCLGCFVLKKPSY